MSDSVRPHRRQPIRLHRPWDSPGKNTGVGCHFLLQCMKVKSESEVAQSCPTLCDPMDCSPPGSFIHGIFQARVLEWGAIAFSNYIGKMWWINLFSFKVLPFSVFHSCTLVLEKEIHWKSLQTWGVWRRMEEWFLQAQSISDELVIIPLEQKLNLEFKNKLYILF